MNSTDRGRESRPGSLRVRALKVAVAVALAATTAGCADHGRERSAGLPEMRALPLKVSGTESAQAYYVLGRYRYFNGDLAGAEQAYRTATTLDPADPEPWNGLAVLHDRLGQFDRSAGEYQAALERAPAAPHILANLGYSLLLQGRSEEARSPLRRAVALAPGDTIARANLARAESATPIALAAPATAEPPAEDTGAAPTPAGPAVASGASAAPPASAASIVTSVLAARDGTGTGIVRNVVGAAQLPSPGNTSRAVAVAAPPVATLAPPPMIASVQGAEVRQPAALGPLFAGVRIELSNGNGVTGMAKGMKAQLGSEGLMVTRVTNAMPYDKRQTTIICDESLNDRVRALAQQLRISPRVVFASVRHRNVDLRVILGRDAVRNTGSSA